MPSYEDISPLRLKERLSTNEAPLLLDVRENWEFNVTRIEGSRHLPMGELPSRVSELDPKAEVVVICHHGARSAHVAEALSQAGFERVFNLAGGLDAYAGVDSEIRKY